MGHQAAITERIESKILGEIPMSKQMGFRVTRIFEDGADCFLPLESNSNHLGTQFGGSLYSAGALSSYTALLGLVSRLGLATNNIVITEGHIEYFSPGTGDVELQARLPLGNERKEFEEKLKTNGRARMKLCTEIFIRSSTDPIARVLGEYLVRDD